MSNYMISLIRTWVPVGVGAVAAWLAARGLHLDPAAQAGVTAALTAGFTAAYYAGVRALEHKYPAFGWLLGAKAKPVYGALPQAEVNAKPTSVTSNPLGSSVTVVPPSTKLADPPAPGSH